MAPTQLLFLPIIFLSVLPGADAVSTVRNVAVQSGGSVTIPCHYDRKYEKHVKYWCKGYSKACVSGIRTNSPTVRGATSITDDPTHHVFTITIKKLTLQETGYYWCGVDGGGEEVTALYLSVTADAPGLWVDQQEVTGVEGGHVSVRCHYNESSSMRKWCRAEGSCVEVNSTKSGRAEIEDDRYENVFIVTVRDLNGEDTGWYWCSAGVLRIPVHITVTQKTTRVTTSTLLLLLSPSELTIVLMTSGILLLVVAVAVVTWKLWKKHKSVQANARAREDRRNELASVGCEEVIYSNVFTKTQPPSYRESPPQSQRSVNPADEVMYSSVILQNPQGTPSPNLSSTGTPSDVIYSSVAQQKKWVYFA